jgi:hypothetical protein
VLTPIQARVILKISTELDYKLREIELMKKVIAQKDSNETNLQAQILNTSKIVTVQKKEIKARGRQVLWAKVKSYTGWATALFIAIKCYVN